MLGSGTLMGFALDSRKTLLKLMRKTPETFPDSVQEYFKIGRHTTLVARLFRLYPFALLLFFLSLFLLNIAGRMEQIGMEGQLAIFYFISVFIFLIYAIFGGLEARQYKAAQERFPELTPETLAQFRKARKGVLLATIGIFFLLLFGSFYVTLHPKTQEKLQKENSTWSPAQQHS